MIILVLMYDCSFIYPLPRKACHAKANILSFHYFHMFCATNLLLINKQRSIVVSWSPWYRVCYGGRWCPAVRQYFYDFILLAYFYVHLFMRGGYVYCFRSNDELIAKKWTHSNFVFEQFSSIKNWYLFMTVGFNTFCT